MPRSHSGHETESHARSSENDEPPLTETTAPQPVSPFPSQRLLWYAPERPSIEETVPPPAPAPLSPPSPPVSGPPIEPISKQATHLYTVSYLIFFALFGTLVRLGLQSLTFYPGAPVITGVLWANVAGSLVMGFLSEDRNLFREEWGSPPTPPKDADEAHEHVKTHKAVKKTIPLYIGLSAGFCGCCTSFSSFIRDVFLALGNALQDPSLPANAIPARNGGYSVMALLAVILVTVSLSLSALIFGAHLALGLAGVTPTFPFAFTRRVLDRAMVFVGWGCWLGAVFLAIWPPDRFDAGADHWRGRAVFALVFAPPGCLLRYYASLHLNSRIPTFPLGTFAVNIFGTIIEGMCFDLQHVSGLGAVIPAAMTGCQVLQGVMDGFCGSTTTVSTWVAELNGVSRRRHAYVYGLVSVAVALGFMVVIMGSLLWTRGFDPPVCG